MIKIHNDERILLLQGPMGNFFTRLAVFLRSNGAQVLKINFNGGDWLFYRDNNAINYRDTMENWSQFLKSFLLENNITKIFLFGDCRYYHREAIKTAKNLGIEAYVFEEGYIRPDYITLEKGGVNGNSSLPRNPDFYTSLPPTDPEPKSLPAHTSFRRMAVAAMSYYLAGTLLRPYFCNYEHHKSFSVIFKAYLWCKSGAMKMLYTSKGTQLSHRLASELSMRYFLVPLQVHNDAQVTFHSHYSEIQDFIREVVVSFAKHAPSDTLLVIKHHPMDRGSKHYGEFINRLAKEHIISGRIIYTHQIHLPTALDNARGVIVINSTVGLSALLHNTPVITLGSAIYNIPGLTCQQPLENFWGNPGQASLPLLKAYRAYVISTTQLNGSFYGLDPLPALVNPH